jgi:hypothetical protein
MEHRGFLFQDRTEGEGLMALAVMCGPRCGQPDRDIVDGGFDQLTGHALGVDG